MTQEKLLLALEALAMLIYQEFGDEPLADSVFIHAPGVTDEHLEVLRAVEATLRFRRSESPR